VPNVAALSQDTDQKQYPTPVLSPLSLSQRQVPNAAPTSGLPDGSSFQPPVTGNPFSIPADPRRYPPNHPPQDIFGEILSLVSAGVEPGVVAPMFRNLLNGTESMPRENLIGRLTKLLSLTLEIIHLRDSDLARSRSLESSKRSLEDALAKEKKLRDDALSQTNYGQTFNPTPDEMKEVKMSTERYQSDPNILGNANLSIPRPQVNRSSIFADFRESDSYPSIPRAPSYLTNLLNFTEFSKQIFGENKKKAPIVTIMRDSLGPWLSYWKDVFSKCMLHGMYVMDPRLVPKDEEGWKQLDNRDDTYFFYRDTIYGFRFGSGKLPVVHRFDSIVKSNGIMLAVAESWPNLPALLCQHLFASIGSGLRYIIEDKFTPSFVNLRLAYFSVVKHHLLPHAQALNTSLASFLNFTYTKVARNEPPASYAAKLTQGQRMVNIQFRKKVIGDEILEVMFLMGIKSFSGSLYTQVIDILTLESISGGKRNFNELVSALQEKWIQTRNEAISSSLVEGAAKVEEIDSDTEQHETDAYNVLSPEPSTLEMVLYAGGDLHPNSKALEKKKIDDKLQLSNSSKGQKKAIGPCFQFARTGKCRFGDKCKYSHKIAKETTLSLTEVLAQVNEILRSSEEQVNALRLGKNRYKQKYSQLRDSVRLREMGRQGQVRPKGSKKEPPVKFFEDVVKADPDQVNAATDSKNVETEDPVEDSTSDSDEDYL
jgi:hypothetical protein